MRWGTLTAVVLVASLTAVAVGGGVVAGQQNGIRIHDATVGEPSIEQGDSLSVTIEFTSTDPSTTTHEVSIKANGAELDTTLLSESTGERATRTTTVYDTDSLEPGTYTITVEDTEAGQLQVTESDSVGSGSENSIMDGFLGPVGKLIGVPLLGLGVIFFFGGIVIEIARTFKEYVGDGSDRGMKPAIVSVLIGSFGMFSGGFLFGGTWAVIVGIVGLVSLIANGVLFGGFYGVLKLYREL
ncbi:COG1361 family protein [Natrinema versiforme]|uniref:Uncharacterized protein n=1 Tax=Natrinema versiforme JCM 10478 TaxID=1227496 RepID=L9Y547_9EURY|nr:hypothetical protein [Natrinema versiforme]ELY68847.1 hypothetical protein C489_05758 [Natrinema versiforme JCM 10478]